MTVIENTIEKHSVDQDGIASQRFGVIRVVLMLTFCDIQRLPFPSHQPS